MVNTVGLVVGAGAGRLHVRDACHHVGEVEEATPAQIDALPMCRDCLTTVVMAFGGNTSVSNQTLDRLMCSARGDVWTVEQFEVGEEEARLIRGRAYYSARIHEADVRTSYRDGVLTIKAMR